MKKNIGVIFGGRSTEHEVSVWSAATVLDYLGRAGYSAAPIYVPQKGAWRLLHPKTLAKKSGKKGKKVEVSLERGCFTAGGRRLKLDALFPVIHGSTGEDGVLQGFLELLGLPYVGSGVLSSAAGMDKVLSKEIAREHGLPLLPHVEISGRSPARIKTGLKAARRLGFPLFVKPVQLGSSVGVTRVVRRSELAKAVNFAFRFDSRVMIEKGVDHAREIVCGVLGSSAAARSSVTGEVKPKGKHEFFDFEAKYLDEGGMDFIVPAPVSKATAAGIRKFSAEIFRAMGCRGMARVDFLVDPKNDRKYYFCEINTIPGFTSHSLYPTLWKNTGLDPVKLTGGLVELAFERSREKARLKTVRK